MQTIRFKHINHTHNQKSHTQPQQTKQNNIYICPTNDTTQNHKTKIQSTNNTHNNSQQQNNETKQIKNTNQQQQSQNIIMK